MGAGEIDYSVIDRSGSGEPARGVCRQAWSPAGLLWPAANLAAITVGLFPRLISPELATRSTLPALQALTVGQVGFALIVYPLVLIYRGRRPGRLDAIELALLAALAAPFVAAAAYLSDGAAPDVVRAVLVVVAAFVVGWCLGRLGMGSPSKAHLTLLVGLAAVLGGPMVVYIVWEFGAIDEPAAWLHQGCPVTLAWSVAASRQPGWVPSPVWSWLLWPVGIAMVLCVTTLRRRAGKDTAHHE